MRRVQGVKYPLNCMCITPMHVPYVIRMVLFPLVWVLMRMYLDTSGH